MKNLKYIIAVMSSVFAFASCSLDETNYMEIEKSKYMNTAAEAESVLLGVYENLTKDQMYGFHLSLYLPLGTDIAKVEGSTVNSWRAMPSNSFSPSESYVCETWAALYNAIYDANDFIEGLSVAVDKFSSVQEKNLAAIYMAEARALRAQFYFELVRWWGNIVLMKTPDDSSKHPSTFEQSTPQEVYEFIEEDLKYAISILPYATEDSYRSDNSFRISKGAALGLLAKVYATWAGYPVRDESKWEKAASTAKILIDSGKHGLLSDFEQLWKNTCNSVWDPTESLMEVSFYAPVSSGKDPVGRIGKWNGTTAADGTGPYVRIAANWKVVPTFVANWKDNENDLRWATSFADYQYKLDENSKKTVKVGLIKDKPLLTFRDAMTDASIRKTYNNTLTPAKWDLNKYVKEHFADANFSTVNWYFLRYADVLLLYAEALNEWHKAPTAEAYAAVNMVRRRGFGKPVNVADKNCDLATGLSYEAFQQAVRDERSYELCFEGHRRQDLVRWGIYYDSIMQTSQDLATWHEEAPSVYIIADYTVKGKHEILPIPQLDLDLMTKCHQNPNW
ncbi:MAG: RagB/SusD family nutrient uptake outer membrane protein [Bacteroidales bacterium]|nr:RagB/SusD family nutrient uptake outer membrane protein [Bacteroidales bacterium]